MMMVVVVVLKMVMAISLTTLTVLPSNAAARPRTVTAICSIERDSKALYMLPAFELKTSFKGNDALLPAEWSGVIQGLQQASYPPPPPHTHTLTRAAGAVAADIE